MKVEEAVCLLLQHSEAPGYSELLLLVELSLHKGFHSFGFLVF